MAGHLQFYPSHDAEAIVRGDPHAYIVRVSINDVDQDITTWTWQSQVRATFDGRNPISTCADFQVVSPDDLPDVFADSSTVPCVLLARWTGEQTELWHDGFVSDVAQVAPEQRTWIIMDHLRVDKDVSRDE